MAISAALVKELRERTGAGMMECKKALIETDGDIEVAIELMRKSGQAKAAKKAGRTAAEGMIVVKTDAGGRHAVMVEVNCETDFVVKDDHFGAFADAVAARALNGSAVDVEALVRQPLRDGESTTIEEARQGLIAKIGENVDVRRLVRMQSTGILASYRHGVRIGVLVDLEGGNAELGRDLAMHIAASSPLCVTEDQVEAELMAKEREIAQAQAQESGKPAEIVTKMVEGRLRKWLNEITLVGQPFVKDPDMKVAKLLEMKGAKVISFRRYEVGEGIAKKQENFAAEVKAQMRGQ